MKPWQGPHDQPACAIGAGSGGKSLGGSVNVSATTRSMTASSSGGIRDGRVLSTSNPSVPASMKRCCQRHTQVLALPVARMISVVPTPYADSSTICARHFRSAAISAKRLGSEELRLVAIPVRMPQTRMRRDQWESPADSSVRCSPLA